MNDYIKTFNLKPKEINQFIGDFIDIPKLKGAFKQIGIQVKIDGIHIDYITKFNLFNRDLINKFIDDFGQHQYLDEMIKTVDRMKMEDEMGLGIFREEHQRWLLQVEERKLKHEFDKRLN
jgi:hypothetical protein